MYMYSFLHLKKKLKNTNNVDTVQVYKCTRDLTNIQVVYAA